MSPNVSAMMHTIRNFIKLATPGERLEFRVAMNRHLAGLKLLDLPGGNHVKTFVCSTGDSGVVPDLRVAGARDDNQTAARPAAADGDEPGVHACSDCQ